MEYFFVSFIGGVSINCGEKFDFFDGFYRIFKANLKNVRKIEKQFLGKPRIIGKPQFMDAPRIIFWL